MSALIDTLAEAAADAFHDAAGEAVRWPALPAWKQATFRAMAREAWAAARQYRGAGLDLKPVLARVMCDAFLANPDCPRWLRLRYDWAAGVERDAARPVFLATAEAVIAAGAEARRRQDLARSEAA